MSADLQTMGIARGSLAAHAPAAGAAAIERVFAAAEPLRGARVVHLTLAGAGGRVPELLSSLLPLATDAGLEVEWRVLFGGPELQATAAALHDGLQGAETAIADAAWLEYLEVCERAAAELGERDVLVLHDPGSLGLAAAAGGKTIWRCHVDASLPDPPVLERIAPLAERCTGVAFPDESFAPEPLREGGVTAAPPGIDPLSPRNLEPAPRLAGRVVRPLGVDLTRPFVCQLMRLDRWKDPHETIEAFSQAREALPGLQLVIAAALDGGGADEWRAAKEVRDYAAGQEDVLLLTSYEGVGNLEVGALQRLARLAVQRALREGFGLGASEALWKGTPVVGGTHGGLPLQIRDGVDGYLVETGDEVAARIVELVGDPGLAVEMGRAGRERVRERFLITHALEHELAMLASVLGVGGATVGRP